MYNIGIGLALPMKHGFVSGGDPKKVMMRDKNNGLVFSEDFDKDSPTWTLKNVGLTSAQAKSVTQAIVTASGEAYVACCYNNGGGAFIAYSPSLGSDFTIIEDHATITAKLGTNTETFITAIAYDKVNNRVGYVIGKFLTGTGYSAKLYLGSGSTFTGKASITGMGGGTNNCSVGNLTYGGGKWFLTSSGSSATDRQFWRFSDDGLTQEAMVDVGDGNTNFAVRAGDTSKIWMFSKADKTMVYTPDNGVNVSVIGSALAFSVGTRVVHSQLAVDETGSYLMAPVTVGGVPVTAKSSDGGSTWATAGSLPTNKTRSHFYCGKGADGLKFIAAASAVYYTKDFGLNWLTKTGNLTSIIASPSIDLILSV